MARRPPISADAIVESGWLARRARLFRLESRLADDAVGDLAFLADEAREVVEPCIRGLHGAIDEHAPAEIRLLDDPRDLAREPGDDRLRVPAGANSPNHVEG
jgi:hypothetical protein